ncbi:MAG TPA: hypothetical protein PKN86_02420 [Candidatus Obscuribacter sp.]|nr:hypothetical protein [Candidatus Obscuribacter sp.]HMX44997.1 hypothetical protein [Candidatus Obscuribacter sp.]HNA74768.1 hypothetical protein [Candidatus Obscuribacter sp.]HNB16410.1 hypothetical protein [Candidatus Obscuribacter sp.]HND67205.1 hypothetical protein [Candidatus Obscuribacter sp.]
MQQKPSELVPSALSLLSVWEKLWIVVVCFAYLALALAAAHLLSSTPFLTEPRGMAAVSIYGGVLVGFGFAAVVSWSSLPRLIDRLVDSGMLSSAERLSRIYASLLQVLSPLTKDTALAVAVQADIERARGNYDTAVVLAYQALLILRRHDVLMAGSPGNEEEDSLVKALAESEQDNITGAICRRILSNILCDLGNCEQALKEILASISDLEQSIQAIQKPMLLSSGPAATGAGSGSGAGAGTGAGDGDGAGAGAGVGAGANASVCTGDGKAAAVLVRHAQKKSRSQLSANLKFARSVLSDALSVAGRAYNLLERYDEAERFLERASQLKQELAADDLSLQEVRAQLALTFYLSGRLSDCQSLVQQGLSLLTGKASRAAGLVRSDLLVLEAKVLLPSKPIEAKVQLQEALKIRRKWLGAASLEIAEVLESLTVCFDQTGESDSASKAREDAARIKARIKTRQV